MMPFLAEDNMSLATEGNIKLEELKYVIIASSKS